MSEEQGEYTVDEGYHLVDEVEVIEKPADWYAALIEDCKAILVEAVFNSRWELLAGYHALGKRIVTENNLDREEVYGKKILRGLSKSIGLSEFNLYKSVQFYKKFPDITMLPDGKNISWTKVLKLLPEPLTETPALPDGKYRVIYADPPWQYNSGDQHTDETQATVLGTHYPSMSIRELCDLKVKDLVPDNAVLFIWVTSPLLDECFEVINAWGFEYKTSIVWDKQAHNVGNYVSVRHEFLLICTKGSCQPDTNKLLPSVVSEKRTEHSCKPEIFRQMINTMYPEGKRIELFARRIVPGWETWGNESISN